jgi:hypothetical protein
MGVEFNEDQPVSQSQIASAKPSAMISWLIKKGIVKDVATGNKVLIGSSIAFFALALYFFL